MSELVKKNDSPTGTRFKRSRWVFLALAILSNSFLIFYSCLPSDVTAKWNWAITNFISNIINNTTTREIEVINITELDINLASEESYKYNYIPGYQVDEIPLGSAKQIDCHYLPDNATDKSVYYYTDNEDIVKLNQSGNTLSVVGKKVGIARIYAQNKSTGITSHCDVKVIDTVAPVSYEISVNNSTVSLGSQETINIDIDGGVLGHNELINFRYYDTRKLSYTSSDEGVLTVDEHGVIHPVSMGETKVTVSNGSYIKQLDITVIDGVSPTAYSDLKISGSSVCYGNDMINDQSSSRNHYQLEIKDGDTLLNPHDFTWSSSNELLAKVDKHGVLRGFRKQTYEDELVIITATSKLTGQSVSYLVTVKEELPTKMQYWIVSYGEIAWDKTNYTTYVGDDLSITLLYTPNIQNKDVTVTVSNTSIIEVTNQGATLKLNVKAVGECTITFTSVVNPELSATIVFTVLKAGAIDGSNIYDFNYSLRKILGHAFVFGVAQVFTFIALYMFLYNKKIYLYSLISFGVGIFIAFLSEFIEYFVPGRNWSIIDVLIDLSGVIVALLICISIFLIHKQIKQSKSKKDENKQ